MPRPKVTAGVSAEYYLKLKQLASRKRALSWGGLSRATLMCHDGFLLVPGIEGLRAPPPSTDVSPWPGHWPPQVLVWPQMEGEGKDWTQILKFPVAWPGGVIAAGFCSPKA